MAVELGHVRGRPGDQQGFAADAAGPAAGRAVRTTAQQGGPRLFRDVRVAGQVCPLCVRADDDSRVDGADGVDGLDARHAEVDEACAVRDSAAHGGQGRAAHGSPCVTVIGSAVRAGQARPIVPGTGTAACPGTAGGAMPIGIVGIGGRPAYMRHDRWSVRQYSAPQSQLHGLSMARCITCSC